MKLKLISVMVAVIALFSTTSCIAQGKVFKEVAKLDGVTAVYISKAMLRLGSQYIDKEVSKGVKSLDGLEIVTCENARSRKLVEGMIDKEIQDAGAEIWLAVQKPDETVYIYAVSDGDTTTASHLYILHTGDSLEFISMAGKFDLDQIQIE